MSMRIEVIPGRPKLAVSRSGTGAPILFLHGIGGNRRNWDGEVERFGSDRMALALDFRGYGDSEDTPEPFHFFAFVADVVRALDFLGLGQADVVGLSMGGLVAQALYARHPERVRSLCLAACRPGSAPVASGESGAAFAAERRGPVLAGGAAQLADSLLPKLLGRSARPAATAKIRDSLQTLRPGSYLAALEARMGLEPFLDLARIAVPTLVVAGGDDRVAPLAQMEELAAAIPGSQLRALPGAGHLLNIEEPELFGAALSDFLDAVDGGRAQPRAAA